jgi:signal transduction histidine kinase
VKRLVIRVLRAPVAARTWRELGYVLVSLVPAVPAFVLALVGLVASVLSLLTVGVPILVAVLATARLASRAFRPPARAILGWDRPLSPTIKARNPIGWGRAVLRDGAGWRALLYCFAKLPLTAVAAYVGVLSLFAGLWGLTAPAWWFVSPDGFGQIDHLTWARAWLLALQGAGVLLVWPWFLRLLVGIDRVLVRALLEPSPDRERIAALESSRAQLTAESVAVLRAVERDLHDGTQARLVSLGIALSRIEHRVTEPEVRGLVADARGTVTDALAELRDIVRGLHPPALDDGLPTAISTLAARSAVPVDAAVELTGRPSDATASAVYFTVAELLTNVARHAEATRVRIRLTEQADRLRLVVSDDGRGGATTSTGPGGGTGLTGLARRATALDGTLDVVSPPGGPTDVTLTLPREG